MWLLIHLLLPLFLLILCKKNGKKQEKTSTTETGPTTVTSSPEVKSKIATASENKGTPTGGEKSKKTAASDKTSNSKEGGSMEVSSELAKLIAEKPIAQSKQSTKKLKKVNAGATPRRLVKRKSLKEKEMEVEPTQLSESADLEQTQRSESLEEEEEEKKSPGSKKIVKEKSKKSMKESKKESKKQKDNEGNYEEFGPSQSEAKRQTLAKVASIDAGGGQYESLGPVGATAQPSKDRSIYDEAGSAPATDEIRAK